MVIERGGLDEVGSVKEFGAMMDELGIWKWWRRGMGFEGEGIQD